MAYRDTATAGLNAAIPAPLRSAGWHICSGLRPCIWNTRRRWFSTPSPSGSTRATASASSGATATASPACWICSTGRIAPDAGRVTRAAGVRIGVLDQADTLDGQRHRRSRTRRRQGRTRVGRRPRDSRRRRRAWSADIDWDAPISTLSGGQRRRVALAALLVGDWDVIALDEPTNHLDVEGITWLAAHLKRRWAAQHRRAAGGHPRPLVPRRGGHDDLGGARPASSSRSRAATRPTSCSASSATGRPRRRRPSGRT